jgi:hypothetical protein
MVLLYFCVNADAPVVKLGQAVIAFSIVAYFTAGNCVFRNVRHIIIYTIKIAIVKAAVYSVAVYKNRIGGLLFLTP